MDNFPGRYHVPSAKYQSKIIKLVRVLSKLVVCKLHVCTANRTLIHTVTIYAKPRVSALGQPLQKRSPASDWADPQIPRRSIGKRHHSGDDVCGGSCVWVDGTFHTIPTVGNVRSGSFLFPPKSFLLRPKLFQTQTVVELLMSIHMHNLQMMAILHIP